MKGLFLFGTLLAAVLTPTAASASAVPPDPAFFAYRQRSGTRLPVQAIFRDANGREMRLGDLAQGLPMVLALTYYHCPNLCGFVRADLFRALRAANLRAGRDYALAVLSIDPTETSSDAKTAEIRDAAAFAASGVGGAWHYLTGSQSDVQAVADAVGFRDRLDRETKQFVHPAGIVFVTSSGIVSSYLLGLGYTATDVRSAVQRADAGTIAAAASPVLLLCFHFDPTTGRYTLAIVKLLRLAGLLMVVVIVGMLFLLFRREGNRA